ncbi:sensor domain-containing protein [Kordiimonas laminariae]|uniref:sensor domain-containing protein n=1 Tax=Kordiimonas laminariae TaxID=2917717 RepID=UPI001FF4376D|nr:GGDEF domain-containing protein [Kordiimonas laminariae]
MADTLTSNVSSIAQNGETNATAKIVNTTAVAESLPVGILVCGLTPGNVTEVLFINQFARDIFELPQQLNLPCPIDVLWNPSDSQVLTSQIQEVFRFGGESNFEWSIRAGAIERFLSSQLIPLRNSDGEIYQVVCTVEDQTAEKLAERNLLHHAFHDALTGQPNRVLFRNKLEEAVAECQRTGGESACAVLIINIDRFQQINESFGHSAGDRFLISMASTLRRCIRGADTLARLSGDEFSILVSHFNDIEEVEMICSRIHEAMQQPYDLDGNEVFTSVSVGVATTLSSSSHPEDLIRDADFAMHRAKSAGKARTEIYRRDSHQRARNQFHLETELRRAVERNELDLFYQPIIDLQTNELHGFEGLTRWIHKEKGFVSPAEFIPLAEETGVIVKLGRWAVEAACQQLRSWIDDPNATAVPVNVNVSGIQFARDDVAAMVESAIKEYEIPGEYLRVELTESSIMANPTHISESLQRIRKLGVKVALDDFGTGYSSLNYLHQFPIDIIKIDRSFINQLEQDNEIYKILKMISLLAESLGHEVVAEGIEDTQHIGMLQDMGFSFAQGFYYSKPVESSAATNMVTGELPWS